MNKPLLRIILFYFIFTFCSVSYSQNIKGEKSPLTQVLLTLETRYNIKFSFETKTVERILVDKLHPELSLTQALKQLQILTQLQFKILNNRFIAITPPKKNNRNKNIQQLDEVVINNYLAKGISKTINGAISIKTKAFDMLPGVIEPDVLQIVERLPGIVSVNERISNLNIRGGTNDQNLIVYDGIRLYQSGHFFGLISAFNPYLTEDITVSKNGTSAKFGDGVSSIISIKNSDSINGQLKAGFGVNLLSIDGFAKIPLSKKTALQLSARRSITDVFSSPTYNTYFDRIFRDSEFNTSTTSNTLKSEEERFFFYDLNAKFLYDINKTTKLRFNVVTLFNTLNYNQTFTDSNTTLQTRKSTLNQTSFGTSISYSKYWKNGINTTLKTYFSSYNLDAENTNVTSSQKLIQKNDVADYGIRLEAQKSVSKHIKLTAGYQLNEVAVSNFEDVINPTFTSLSKKIIRTHALFGETKWTSNSKKTYIKFGLRGNYFEKFARFLVEPRLSVNQKISNYFRLEILGELKSQSLTQIIDLQQNFFGIEKRRWQLADTNSVPIITSQQVSVGLNYNKNGWLMVAEGYYKKVNAISAQSQGFQNQYQFANAIGAYNIKGFDILLNKRFTNISTWLSYSYSKNNYLFSALNNGKSFPNSVDLKHVINTSLTYNFNGLKIGLGINWHSGKPYTLPLETQNNNTNTIDYQSPNAERLNAYFRTDISATYNFKLSKKVNGEFGVSIWNLFNKTNIINRYYTLNTDDTIIKIDNPSLKFTPNFSFRVHF
ncbi:MAG: TonB-dependent receptor domain-containing protein [Winogradskyella sp.]